MAKGINKVILVGNLGQDPEVRYGQNGGAMATFTVATSESWTDKQSGQKQERTEWHNITIFGRLGEIAGEYLHKGSRVYLEGKLQTRKWQDQSGNDRWTTSVVCHDMVMLDGPTNDNRSGQSGNNRSSGNQGNRGGNQNTGRGGQGAGGGSNNFDDFDDDIPF